MSGYAASSRNVTVQTKHEIYDEYGITHRNRFGTPGSYEIDHLVPLELGGSNDKSNLFPEPFPAYEAKDHLEDFMHEQVCNGQLELRRAQLFFMRKYAQ